MNPQPAATTDIKATTVMDCALDYIRRGWAVLPLWPIRAGACACPKKGSLEGGHKPGKHPLYVAGLVEHGMTDATTDEVTIRRWWGAWSDAGIGIVCDKRSFLALDVDPRHGGDVNLNELEMLHGPLSETVENLTGGDGRHVLFADPGVEISTKEIATGLEIKASGKGYICAPPTLHISGKCYRWRPGFGPDDLPLAPIPDWLRQKLQDSRSPVSVEGKPNGGKILHPHRTPYLTSLAGANLCRGIGGGALFEVLQIANEERCEPLVDEEKVRKLAYDLTKRYGRGAGTFTGPLDDAGEKTSAVPFAEMLVAASRSYVDAVYDPTPDPPSLIGDGALSVGHFGLIHGRDGSGKSWALLQLAVSAACGLDWLGIPTRAGGLPTGYLSLEDDVRIVRNRLVRVVEALEADETLLRRNLVCIYPPHLDRDLDITNQEHRDGFKAWILHHRLELTVTDHLTLMHSLPDEMNFTPVRMAIREILRDTGTGMVVGHHSRKLPSGSRGKDVAGQGARGDSRLQDSSRFRCRMTEFDGRILFEVEKASYAAKPPERWLRHDPDSGVLALTDAPPSKSVAKNQRKAQMLQRIVAAGETGLAPSDLKDLGVTSNTIGTYAVEMETAGLVERRGERKGMRYVATAALSQGEVSWDRPCDIDA